MVRGGRVIPKEGNWQPRHLLMLEFPSLEQAERWYNSPEYKPLIAIRRGRPGRHCSSPRELRRGYSASSEASVRVRQQFLNLTLLQAGSEGAQLQRDLVEYLAIKISCGVREECLLFSNFINNLQHIVHDHIVSVLGESIPLIISIASP